MEDIFVRVRATMPELVQLTLEEQIRLEFWLRANRPCFSLNEYRAAAEGDADAAKRIAAAKDWHAHLKATLAYSTVPPLSDKGEKSTPPTATAPPAADKGDEGTPPAGRSKGIPLAEAEILVREWLAANAKDNPEAVTRDAVAVGTGVSGATVSRTAVWKAFRERRDAETRPVARNVPLSDTLKATISTGNVGKAESAQRNAIPDEVAALIDEQNADKAEQDRRHKRHRTEPF